MFKRKNTRVSKPCPQPVSSREKFRHPLLGEITLNRSPRARRLSISVRPDGEVRLTIPCGDNERTALNFLDQKSAWIEQARVRMLARHPKQVIEPPYSTRSHTLRLYPCACRTIRTRVGEGIIEVRYPMELRYEAAEVQDAIRKGIEQAWRTEAQADLPQRTARLAGQLGLRCGDGTQCTHPLGQLFGPRRHFTEHPPDEAARRADRLRDYPRTLPYDPQKPRPEIPQTARPSHGRTSSRTAPTAQNLFHPLVAHSDSTYPVTTPD